MKILHIKLKPPKAAFKIVRIKIKLLRNDNFTSTNLSSKICRHLVSTSLQFYYIVLFIRLFYLQECCLIFLLSIL